MNLRLLLFPMDQVVTSAVVAYVHDLSFMVCFGSLVLERQLIRPNPDRPRATRMVITPSPGG